ncbi:hypothetical protein [Streptomyces sp. MN6]
MTHQTTITPDPDGNGFILHLPEITHLDTQVWSADVGLTAEGLAALRAALAHHAPAAVSAAVAPPTNATHGLSVQHADALWDAVAIPGPRTPTYPEQHERVCRAVREILDELTPARDEVADQTALRDRLIDALDNAHHTHPCPELGDKTWSGCVHYDDAGRMLGVGVCHSERRADAVLAVLPEPTDKAAVLHETADAVAQMRIDAEDPSPDDHVRGYNNALNHVEAELRRMADETATEQCECGCGQPGELVHGRRLAIPKPATETATDQPKAARCTCQYIAESWIQMDHAPDCPAAGARQDGAET